MCQCGSTLLKSCTYGTVKHRILLKAILVGCFLASSIQVNSSRTDSIGKHGEVITDADIKDFSRNQSHDLANAHSSREFMTESLERIEGEVKNTIQELITESIYIPPGVEPIVQLLPSAKAAVIAALKDSPWFAEINRQRALPFKTLERDYRTWFQNLSENIRIAGIKVLDSSEIIVENANRSEALRIELDEAASKIREDASKVLSVFNGFSIDIVEGTGSSAENDGFRHLIERVAFGLKIAVRFVESGEPLVAAASTLRDGAGSFLISIANAIFVLRRVRESAPSGQQLIRHCPAEHSELHYDLLCEDYLSATLRAARHSIGLTYKLMERSAELIESTTIASTKSTTVAPSNGQSRTTNPRVSSSTNLFRTGRPSLGDS